MKSKKSPSADLEGIMPLLINAWRRLNKLPGPPDVLQTREFRSVVESIQKLQAGLENGDSLIGKDYFAEKDLLGAYLLYQWVIHYQQGLSLINEIPITPDKVLDIGSGPGAMAFAALRHGANNVTALDRNVAALELGAEICGKYGMPLTIRKCDCLRSPLPVEGHFDLIILSHCLGEFFPTTNKNWREQQKNYVTMLLKKLTPQGFLLIVDNSYPEANQRILSLRDQLVKDRVPVQAPCVWHGECPALSTPNSPCYAQRELVKPYMIKQIQRAANINLNSLKMSYVIFKSPQANWPELPEAKNYYRVISPPVDAYQSKRYYLCGTDGKKKLESHLKIHPNESKAFEYIRRGELISIENGLLEDNCIDIIEGTQLKVEAACGKAIPEKFEAE